MRLKKTIIALAFAASVTLTAAEVRVTDADQRFKIKYGIWPPHVERAMRAEAESKREARSGSKQKEKKAERKERPDGVKQPSNAGAGGEETNAR